MPRIPEEEVHDALIAYNGTGTVNIGDTTVEIELEAEDIHTHDRPDELLWFNAEIEIFHQALEISIPLPIEAEASGIKDAVENDLAEFIQRENYSIKLPMLVVTDRGFDSNEVVDHQKVEYDVTQIPRRLID